MRRSQLRLLGSGYTAEECELYGLANLENLDDASNFLSRELYIQTFRPTVNNSAQKHVLEDKWITQLYLQSIGVSMPTLVGFYHPQFGTMQSGAPLRTPQQLQEALWPLLPTKLILKPRGGRQGRNIVSAEFSQGANGAVQVTRNDHTCTLSEFLQQLPADVFGDYDGGYAGWLVQHYVHQHPFLLTLAPYAVNTCRLVTLITADNECKVLLAVLKLGRKGSVADGWSMGGLSVHIDCSSGTLGRGVFTLKHGGQWVSEHPDTGVRFEGLTLPMWDSMRELCDRAARGVSGVRSVGWDVALTRDGPVILEGNADWSLPFVQVHTRGLLTPEVRADLQALGAHFPREVKAVSPAVLGIATRQLLTRH